MDQNLVIALVRTFLHLWYLQFSKKKKKFQNMLASVYMIKPFINKSLMHDVFVKATAHLNEIIINSYRATKKTVSFINC